MSIRIGRWQLELHRRAIHITREPDPNCPDCFGSRGGWQPTNFGADWDECQCLDQLRTWRIPYWPRTTTTYAERNPF